MERFNAACNAIAQTAFREHTANQIRLQKLVYAEIRETFGLLAQMTVRAISKAAEAYKRDKSRQPTFRAHGAIIYDQRIWSCKGLDRGSILTLEGRHSIPVVLDRDHQARMTRIRGQADLLDREGPFYLAVVVDVLEPPPLPPDDGIGVDLGIVNLAADSDGKTYSGGQVNGLRKHHAKLRPLGRGR